MAITKGKEGFNKDVLFHRRRMLGLTMRDIAKKMDCTYNAVSQWETGKFAPNPKSLIKLAKTLKVKPDYFYKHAPKSVAA